MAKIFISYKRADKDIVFPIVDEIKKKTGISCWIDLDGIESGDQFQNVIIDAIDKSDIVVFMLSKNYISPFKDKITGEINHRKQTFPEKEVMYALRHNKRLIPISIDGTKVSDCKWLDFNCSGLDRVDWDDKDKKNKFFLNLINWSSNSICDQCNNSNNNEYYNVIEKTKEERVSKHSKLIKIIIGIIVIVCLFSLLYYTCLNNPGSIAKKSYNFITTSYRIKIQKESNGSFVYSSWKINEYGKPDIVLTNGIYDNQNHIFIFSNGTYQYYVGDINYSIENIKSKTDSLIVINENVILLKEPINFEK